MSVVKKHKSSFDRQIFEAVLIYRGGQNVLNSRSQYSRCQVPRLSVMVGENLQYDNAALKNEKEKLKKRIAEKSENPKKRRKFEVNFQLKVGGESKDKTNTYVIKDSRESNPNPEEHVDESETHNDNDRKRFPIPATFRTTKRRKPFKSIATGQPPISSYFKSRPVFSFSSSPDQT